MVCTKCGGPLTSVLVDKLTVFVCSDCESIFDNIDKLPADNESENNHARDNKCTVPGM